MKNFNRLTLRRSQSRRCIITANAIAHQLLTNDTFKNFDKQHDLHVRQETISIWKSPIAEDVLSTPFFPTELAVVITPIKSGKAQSSDKARSSESLQPQMSSKILHSLYNAPNEPHNVVTGHSHCCSLPKPGKLAHELKSYRSIRLLCFSYKLFHWLLLERLEPVFDHHLTDQ